MFGMLLVATSLDLLLHRLANQVFGELCQTYLRYTAPWPGTNWSWPCRGLGHVDSVNFQNNVDVFFHHHPNVGGRRKMGKQFLWRRRNLNQVKQRSSLGCIGTLDVGCTIIHNLYTLYKATTIFVVRNTTCLYWGWYQVCFDQERGLPIWVWMCHRGADPETWEEGT